jgi:hypothetical protein
MPQMKAPIAKQRSRKPLANPIPIRFSAETLERIDRAAPIVGGNRNTVIRMAVNTLLPQLEAGHLDICVTS